MLRQVPCGPNSPDSSCILCSNIFQLGWRGLHSWNSGADLWDTLSSVSCQQVIHSKRNKIVNWFRTNTFKSTDCAQWAIWMESKYFVNYSGPVTNAENTKADTPKILRYIFWHIDIYICTKAIHTLWVDSWPRLKSNGRGENHLGSRVPCSQTSLYRSP